MNRWACHDESSGCATTSKTGDVRTVPLGVNQIDRHLGLIERQACCSRIRKRRKSFMILRKGIGKCSANSVFWHGFSLLTFEASQGGASWQIATAPESAGIS